MEYERYIDNTDNENNNICIRHRMLYGLPVNIDLENIDCEYECKAYKTCPFNPNNENKW